MEMLCQNQDILHLLFFNTHSPGSNEKIWVVEHILTGQV